jgi:Leucine-rich repeat (LRR) protein
MQLNINVSIVFAGEIPPSIFSLPALSDLDLSHNQLSGPIYGFDAESRLAKVHLSNNALSGFIPEAFFQPTSLVHIDVSSNKLIGSVDLSHFRRLSKLVSLDLSNNELHVLDADANSSLATSLAGLRKLGLASCNMTRFPRFLRHLNYISYLDLSHNKISGHVPNCIWEAWSDSLFHLNLSHNMFTGMQLTSGVLPFTTPLQVFDLSFNRLTGQIPMPNSSAVILEYSNNRYSSILPNWTLYLSDTSYLSMSKNNINGHVPHLICTHTLDVLDLSYNKFSGPIPSCLIKDMGVKLVLNLRENHFEGTLPSNIASACCLQTIDLHGNMIEGNLPAGLSNCLSLEVLDLGGNRIRDTFPSWLRGLPELSVLILRSNQLYGTIGDIIGDTKSDGCFPSLQIIDLASNNFSGYLRPQWFKLLKSMMMTASNTSAEIISSFTGSNELYQDFTEIIYKGFDVKFDRILTTLTTIDFSNNRLEGNIPETIGKLVSLRVLNLSHNAFTGNIPAELGGVTALESLDLSCNQLSGEIPQELTDLTFLDVLNLSDNHLVGKIPQSRQFSTFDSNSFEGNARLCGPPLSNLPCGASPHTPGAAQVDKPFHHVDVVLFLFAGLGFGVGFAAAILVRWNRVCRWFMATGSRGGASGGRTGLKLPYPWKLH